MSKPGVAIRGQGVAAWCCARLLHAAGFRVSVQERERPRIPAILVSQSTQALICDVFGVPDLFRGLYVVDRRVVSWGGGRASVLPHSAVVISEEELVERLRAQSAGSLDQGPPDAQWTIHASPPLPACTAEHRFGTRMAAAVVVDLKAMERSACWIESMEDGWLFLIPSDGGKAWLLAVGNTPECLLAQSRLIGAEIEVAGYAGTAFPAFPRIADPLCGPGWLACGTAALAFDPLCGDGTGNAIREAILASAVIRAAVAGADVDGVLAHYRARLMAGFQRHLEHCRAYYASGGSGPWWQAELEAIQKGIEWRQRELGSEPAFRYRLSGFELQPAAP